MCREGEGKIQIRRISELFLCLEPVKIFIDGKCCGMILSGDEKEFTVKSGKHSVRIQLEMIIYGSFPSNTVILNVKENSIQNLECGSTYHGIRMLKSQLYIFNRSGTFYLKEASSS